MRSGVKDRKPPYAEPLVRWCERSVNTKVGDKHLRLVFTSYSIIRMYEMLEGMLRKIFSDRCRSGKSYGLSPKGYVVSLTSCESAGALCFFWSLL